MNTTKEDVIIQYSYAGLADTGQCMTCPAIRVTGRVQKYDPYAGLITYISYEYTDKHGKPLPENMIVWACWVVSTKTFEKP